MLFKKTRNNIQIITGRETFPRSVSEGTNDTAYDNQHHTREYNFLFPMANVYPPGDALFASLPWGKNRLATHTLFLSGMLASATNTRRLKLMDEIPPGSWG